MKRGRYAEAADGVAGETKPADDGRCHAFGCPLPGAISESLKGGGPWFCRHHFGADGAQWQEITSQIRRQRAEGLDQAPAEATIAVDEMRGRMAARQGAA